MKEDTIVALYAWITSFKLFDADLQYAVFT